MTHGVKRVLDRVAGRGWAGRLVPIGHLSDLREAIRSHYEDGLLDKALYHDQLDSFSFDPPPTLPEAKSVFIIAVPTPQMRVYFHRGGERVPVVIPPTYVSYTARTKSVQAVLAGWMEEEGYRLAETRLPLKTLAVRSGLAEYGRNNICYVSGMGSFLQLVGAFSDAPCDSDPWRESKELNRCNSCVACLRLCPTGAIGADRFLIHAEHCLTYHNEAAGEFPEWIDPSWHHTLVGCMRCQTACPENKPLLNRFEDRGEFSEQETDLLVRRVPFDRIPGDTAMKINSLQINEDYQSLCRNLSTIIDKRHGKTFQMSETVEKMKGRQTKP